jgi:hypothetical protein
MVGIGPDVQSGKTFRKTPIWVSLFGSALNERSTVVSAGACAATVPTEPMSSAIVLAR